MKVFARDHVAKSWHVHGNHSAGMKLEKDVHELAADFRQHRLHLLILRLVDELIEQGLHFFQVASHGNESADNRPEVLGIRGGNQQACVLLLKSYSSTVFKHRDEHVTVGDRLRNLHRKSRGGSGNSCECIDR